ncbi:HAD domain-containing protein [Pseudomonas sp. GW6]
MILFLDIDGVLHPDPPQPDQRLRSLPRLVEVLRDFPQVEVVISSLWREHFTLDQLRDLFPAEIRSRIIDVTPIAERVDGWLPARREGEILEWLESTGRIGEPWLALDDAGWQFTQHRDRLVKCVFYDGLDDRIETLLRQRLATYARCIGP